MDHLDRHDEVVAAGDRRIAGVAYLEAHPIVQALALGGLLSNADRGVVEVEAVDMRVRVRLRDGERRNARAAPDLGDPDGQPGGELGLYVRQRREPVLHEVMTKHRSGEGGLQVVEVEGTEGDASRRCGTPQS